MKNNTLVWIAYLGAGFICLAGGLYMATKNMDGWGWFLLVSVLIFGSISFNSQKKYTENDLRAAFDKGRETIISWSDYLISIIPKDEDEEDEN